VELQKRLTEAANRRDLDAVMSFYAPDALWESRPLGTSFAGAAAIRGFHEDWLAAYEEYEGQTEDILRRRTFWSWATESFSPSFARTPVLLVALATFKPRCVRL